MRWTGLLLAIACSHTQPPPAPLSVPSENAAGPANLPDGGPADAGTVSPDAGAPRADLVAPIIIPGRETPAGLEWGEKGQQPASTIFKNVDLLGGVSGDRFMAAMQSIQASLGQKCVLCHLVDQKDFASDAKKEKLRARDMIRMNEEINRRTFGGTVRVTCWTCHRGNEKPADMGFSRELPEPFAKMPPEQLSRKAEDVFKDVRILRGMDVRNFGFIMGWFAREMGAKCTHCHVENDFAADAPKKTRAREMLEMTSYIAQRYYGNDSPIGCGTCHRGRAVPARTAAEKS
jgi:Photosynthetic reaction centre cytochrome C subunit